MQHTKCFYFVYRISNHCPFMPDFPIGGMVVETEYSVHAHDLARQRWHCAPWEELIVAEVYTIPETAHALELHRQWEQEVRDLELQWGTYDDLSL